MNCYTMTAKEAAAFIGMSYPRFTESIHSDENKIPYLKVGGRYFFSEIAIRQALGEKIEMELEEGELVVI